MVLWVIFAFMTGAAILAVVWPLGRSPRAACGGSDVAVYKDQLREIDRDRTAGLIGEVDAQAARLEVTRRLLAAADGELAASDATPPSLAAYRRRAAAIVAVVVLTFGPLGLYVALGSPNLPGEYQQAI